MISLISGHFLVGCKCVKGKLSQINIKHSQTLPNIKGDQYKQLLHQPYPSQTSPDPSDQVIENLNFDRFLDFAKGQDPQKMCPETGEKGH